MPDGIGVPAGRGRWLIRFTGAGMLVLFFCWQHVQAIRFGYQVEAARREATQRRGRVAALRLEIERRLSPSEVASRAARLGMVPADPGALRCLDCAAPPLLRAISLRKLWISVSG